MQIFTDKAKAGALPDVVPVGAAEQHTELPGCLPQAQMHQISGLATHHFPWAYFKALGLKLTC